MSIEGGQDARDAIDAGNRNRSRNMFVEGN